MAIPGITSTQSAFFTSLINQMMAVQRRPITRLQAKRGQLATKQGLYNDLDTKLDSLKSVLAGLQTGTSSIFGSKGGTVGGKSNADKTILSASVSSTAIVGSYDVAVTTLAQAHRVRSTQQTYSDQALGLAGTFVIGGEASRSTSGAGNTGDHTVTSFSTGVVWASHTELTADTYHVEMRDNSGTLEFRLVDDGGQAMAIDDASQGSNADGDTATTTAWQDLSQVEGTTFDTGRGLTITFGSALANESTAGTSVDAFGVGEVLSGDGQLATDTYYVEVRDNGGGGDWEFRVVNSSDVAQSIYDATANDGSYTTAWQDIDDAEATFTNGIYQTGRGLTIDFGSGPPYTAGTRGAGAASVDFGADADRVGLRGDAAYVTYAAQGASITVATDDTLSDIATAINDATYAENHGVNATIVDNTLVIEAGHAGADFQIKASETSGNVLTTGLGFTLTSGILHSNGGAGNDQVAQDASFTINGISITRSSNTGLTDVISGVTLDLADDAQGESATLTVAADNDAVKAKINDFLSKFNALTSYIKAKTAVTISGSGEDATYTRAGLAGETIFSSLRSRLFSQLSATVSGLPSGAADSLREIGITLNDSLQATVSDSATLDDVLSNDFSNVESLFDAVATNIEDLLEPFTDTDGIMDTTLDALGDQIEYIDDRVSSLEKLMVRRRAVLEKQYGYLQVQIAQMSFLNQRMMGFWGGGQSSRQ